MMLSAHSPCGPESTSAVTRTDESTTVLNGGQRRGVSGSGGTRHASGRAFSLPHLLQPGVNGRSSGQALEFGAQILLHRFPLQRRAGGEFIPNLLRHIANRDLNSHAGIMPALASVCKIHEFGALGRRESLDFAEKYVASLACILSNTRLSFATGCSTVVRAEKGKPTERWGRKASGLRTHGL